MWCRRKRPAMCARITWPLSSSTENVVLGNTCLMLPNTSSGASLLSSEIFALDARGFALRLRVAITDSFPLLLTAAAGQTFYAAIDGRDANLRVNLKILVELSGCCPPSPKSPTNAFSRLSFEFDLLERTSRSRTYRSQQTLCLGRAVSRSRVPARVIDRKTKRFGPTLRVRWLT